MSQPVIITIPDASDSVMFDASIHESHVTTARATMHQVETGPDVSDHIRPMPRSLSLEVMVTNTPVTPATTNMDGVTGTVGQVAARARIMTGVDTSDGGTVRAGGNVPAIPFTKPRANVVDFSYNALNFPSRFDRVNSVYLALFRACQKGSLVNVTTTLESYQSFAITSLTAPRNAGSGNAVTFNIELQEIRTVTVDTVAALPPSVKLKKKSKGNKVPAVVDQTTQQKESFLHSLTSPTTPAPAAP